MASHLGYLAGSSLGLGWRRTTPSDGPCPAPERETGVWPPTDLWAGAGGTEGLGASRLPPSLPAGPASQTSDTRPQQAPFQISKRAATGGHSVWSLSALGGVPAFAFLFHSSFSLLLAWAMVWGLPCYPTAPLSPPPVPNGGRYPVSRSKRGFGPWRAGPRGKECRGEVGRWRLVSGLRRGRGPWRARRVPIGRV